MRKKKLQISSTLALPLDAVTERIAIIAMSGLGKSYCAGVMAEEMLDAKQQIVIVDPKHDYYGLRSKYKILILGGKRGDIPLSDTAGALVAQFIVSSGQSVILDLDGMSISGQKRFMTAFMEEMYRINENPIHLFIDEADEFCPERPMKGDERMLGAGNRIVRRGRSKGMGVTLITQRTASISKNALNQCGTLIMFGMMGVQDLNVVEDYIKRYLPKDERERILKRLTELEQGEAIVYSPRWLKICKEVKIRGKKTFDSSATPRAGQKRKAPRRLAKIDLSKLKAQMDTTVEQIKESDPAHLKKKIAELQAQLAKKQPAPQVVAPPPRALTETVVKEKIKKVKVEIPVLKKRLVNALKKELALAQKLKDRLSTRLSGIDLVLQSIGGKLHDAIRMAQAAEQAFAKQPEPPVEKKAKDTPGMYAPAKAAPAVKMWAPLPAPSNVSANGDVSLVAGERKILEKVCLLHPREMHVSAVAKLAEYKISGTLMQYLGNLKRAGLLLVHKKRVKPTAEGFAHLGVQPREMSGAEERGIWMEHLVRGERNLFTIICDRYPNSITLEELSKESGLQISGTFMQYIGTLRRCEIVYQPEKKTLKMADHLA